MHREINCNILKTTKTYFPWKSKSGRNSWSSNIKIKIIKIYGNCEVMEEHTGNMILAVLRTSEWNFLYFYRNHCLRQTFAWIFFIITAPTPPLSWVERALSCRSETAKCSHYVIQNVFILDVLSSTVWDAHSRRNIKI